MSSSFIMIGSSIKRHRAWRDTSISAARPPYEKVATHLGACCAPIIVTLSNLRLLDPGLTNADDGLRALGGQVGGRTIRLSAVATTWSPSSPLNQVRSSEALLT